MRCIDNINPRNHDDIQGMIIGMINREIQSADDIRDDAQMRIDSGMVSLDERIESLKAKVQLYDEYISVLEAMIDKIDSDSSELFCLSEEV